MLGTLRVDSPFRLWLCRAVNAAPAATADVHLDVLSELLAELRFRSGVFARVEVSAPWGIEVPDLGKAMFHFVPRGACLLEVEGVAPPLTLAEGDVVILPHGHRHFMRDAPARPTKRIDHLLRRHPLGSDRVLRLEGRRGPVTSLVCGGYWFEHKATLSVLRALPPVMHLRAGDAGFEWLRLSQERITRELTSGRPGGPAIAARLADALFIEAARGYLAEQHGDAPGELAAVQDPAVALAVTLLHRHPARRWTVASLARDVALSRAALAERFRALLGEPPMRYLTRQRMTRATRLLRASAASVAEIGAQVGYESEAAFCRAFARHAGTTPAAYRRRAVARAG